MALEFRNVNKFFGDFHVLKDVNLRVEKGRAFGYLGRNGAGKTTSIRILMDVFRADSGEVLLDGVKIDRNSVRMGYLPEERGMYPKDKILNQLVYFAQLKGVGKREAVSGAKELIARVGLEEYMNKPLETLSKGNQQKIQICEALIGNPEILILDEPFSGLDPVNSKLLCDMIMEYLRDDRYLIFSSHQMGYVEDICKDIAIINKGEIIISGDLEELRRAEGGNKIRIKSPNVNKDMILSIASDALIEEYQGGELVVEQRTLTNEGFAMSLLENGMELDSFGIYMPSVGDMFFKYAGREEK